jgi:hypothetical protein
MWRLFLLADGVRTVKKKEKYLSINISKNNTGTDKVTYINVFYAVSSETILPLVAVISSACSYIVQTYKGCHKSPFTETILGYSRNHILWTTGYGLDGPGIESRWGRDFPHLSRPTLGPPILLYNGYRVFLGVRKRPGRDADPLPLLVPWSKKQSKAIPLLSLRAFVVCKNGETYLHSLKQR